VEGYEVIERLGQGGMGSVFLARDRVLGRLVAIKTIRADFLDDPKRRVGKYILLNELGKGGMGIVRRGWDPSLGRYVAIKCLLATGDAADSERLRREAHTAAGLSHPNIVPIHEVFEVDGAFYVVMNHIEGWSLDAVRPPPDQAARVIRDAAEAIHYAHEKGIVHRDLKPGNLMLDPSGRLWVMDFGLARSMTGGSTLTASGVIQGTPAYMSPEQAAGRPCDARSDVYSLGATLYDLLTCRLPFDGEHPLEVLKRIEHDEPVPPRRLVPSTPDELEVIVMKCMEKVPARRYATAADLAADLSRWMKG